MHFRTAPRTPASAEPVIQARDLRMSYGPTEVLHGVTLHAHRGEVLALLGPNGAGKTTTIEVLEGFRKRSSGEVRVLGVDPITGDESWRARLGIVLQSWRDHGRWQVRELLRHLGRYYTPFSTPARHRPFDTDELLTLVGLTNHANARADTLSGGQRRRLDVAIGLVGNPELLFLDEPTVGFDPQARQDFHELIGSLAARGDTTILLTTHDLAEAEKLATRILILAGGKVVANGTAQQLAHRMAGRPEVRFTRAGTRESHSVPDATSFVRDLLTQPGNEDITDLEVRRVSLEEVYLSLVRDHESGQLTNPAPQEVPA
ncbi:ABC transporter ATP-binding protein [Crossiella sp. CA-258035]|uniref:ABC transporter ATP-binding protein n=1 Tax=Crossiella sp. CA-258035 TaxID=2981138 RepID=UPI0024BCB22D|nr:ABC transporter ATP-binding protein [Crossiella sp. CA-258035]WHT19600.1 ABC transporter ATP-binding protein [Crossiella sp. CA-258035]